MRVPTKSKSKNKSVRRPTATAATATASATPPVPESSIVEIIEARMKGATDLIGTMLAEHAAKVLVTPPEVSMREENRVLGEMLSVPSAQLSKDVKPITLNDSHRVELELLFGGEPINSPQDVTRLSHRLARVGLLSPNGHEESSITVPLDYLERLDSRRPIDTTLKEMIEQGFLAYLQGVIDGVF